MKTVLITGASSGIGLSLATIFAKNNYNLILVARRYDRLLELKESLEIKYGIDVVIESMDLLVIDNLKKLWEKHKNIDILINNAGFGLYGTFDTTDLEKELDIISLNITSLVYLTKLYTNSMKNDGKIVNIGSTAGFQPTPYMSIYGASKSFVVDFTLAIQQEIHNPQIILFCPGETKTEFQEKAKRPKSSVLRGAIPSSDDVAKYLYDNLNKNKTFIIWGTYNKLLLLFERFFPKNIIAKLLYKTQKR